MKGTVRVIKAEKNFGFLRGEDGFDYFVHRDSCINACFDKLKPGATVNFSDTEGAKGKRAEDVSI